MRNEVRRNMALFPMRTVMKLTDLTARQIRYYEQHHLIVPERPSGNQRLFSFNDIERLLEIKQLIDNGVKIAGIKQVIQPVVNPPPHNIDIVNESELERKELTKLQVIHHVKQQLFTGQRPGQVSMIQGELSRFFKYKRGERYF